MPAKGERRSEELRARVRALWATDATPAAIGSELGVSATRVYQIKKELNLPDRGRPARPERTPVIREPAARTPLRLTVTQGKLLAILQRAAPHPVGHEFIRTKLFGGVARERGEELLTAALGGLKAACDDAGVVLRDIKGFGISVEVPA